MRFPDPQPAGARHGRRLNPVDVAHWIVLAALASPNVPLVAH